MSNTRHHVAVKTARTAAAGIDVDTADIGIGAQVGITGGERTGDDKQLATAIHGHLPGDKYTLIFKEGKFQGVVGAAANLSNVTE